MLRVDICINHTNAHADNPQEKIKNDDESYDVRCPVLTPLERPRAEKSKIPKTAPLERGSRLCRKDRDIMYNAEESYARESENIFVGARLEKGVVALQSW